MEKITAASLRKKANEVLSFEKRLQKVLFELEDLSLLGKYETTKYPHVIDEDVKKELQNRGFEITKRERRYNLYGALEKVIDITWK
jgi:hypothetical protein|tara:strand:+ start:3921 stop:4178 length:258 start_codon:yes stop_codon:yes gene_type:complete